MKPTKIVAFDYYGTLFSDEAHGFYNPQKLRYIISKFKEQGIHVVIVIDRGDTIKISNDLANAFGHDQKLFLLNDIYTPLIALVYDPRGERFKGQVTKVDLLDFVVESFNNQLAIGAEKATPEHVRFTDDQEAYLELARAKGYPTFAFKTIQDIHGGHPEEGFLDNFYKFATDQKLISAATSTTFAAPKQQGENEPLLVRVDNGDKTNDRSCCPSICAVM